MPSSITLTVKRLPASTSFFLSTLQPLDYVYRGRDGNTIGFGLKDSPPDFWISQEAPGVPAGAAHVAFPAISERRVQEFFIAALKAGGKCHGEPLLRDPATGYYSAAVIDFDGNSIEAVYRPDLVDEGYGSRPSSNSSVGSVKSKAKMSSQAPTVVSKASTAKPKSSAPTEVKSVAPSSVSKAPTQVSKAPTQASKAPTSLSKASMSASKSSTHVSKAPTATPSQVSRAPTAAPSQASRAPTAAPSYISQSPPSQPQTVTYTTPTGEVVTNLVTEARGAISIAKQLVNEIRPSLEQSNSAPNIHTAGGRTSDPNSHKPSDTIVGTLLGVAAGAALTYAYTKANESDKRHDQEALAYGAPPPPQLVRTTTEPPHTNERMLYYQEYNGTQPYAIEAPPSEYAPSGVGSQRYITLEDNAERLSDYAPSQRPRRRSSFSGVDVRSFTSSSRASQNSKSASRMLEAPPTSYRAPTAITQADTDSRVSSRSKSRAGSSARSASESRSHASRRSSGGSKTPSATGSTARTVVPAKSVASRATTMRPEDKSLPPSRAGTSVSKSPTEYLSTHSKANKTTIGKMLDRERTGGRSELTKSVVGKIQDSERLNLPSAEVDPSDSVSQVSSVRSKRSSKK